MPTAMPVFAFIGTGNMGGALATAASKAVPGVNLLLSNRTPAKAEALARQLGATAVDNYTAAARADYLFLGVEPDMLGGLIASLRRTLERRNAPPVIVSMAAVPPVSEFPGAASPARGVSPILSQRSGKNNKT